LVFTVVYLIIIYIVPIYNGLEENFSFDKRGFSRFKKLPLWKKGLAEIPPFSLVTVGFAPSIFVSTSDSSKGANILMPNILFAVIWGSYDV
jgi:hypothetical protein